MIPVEIDPSRRLALRLHALHASDRAWILSQVDAEARARLEPMLQELDSLGFRIDQEILDSVEDRTDVRESHPAAGNYDQHVEVLSKARTESMLKHLKGEPQAILDCLAMTYPWPWLDALQASGAFAKAPMRGDEPYLGPTPRVRQALLAELAQQVAADHPAFGKAAPAIDTNHQAADAAGTATSFGLRRWWLWKR